MTLEADPVRLAQVLTNLLNNAAKYTEPGGQIWLTARRENDEAVVSVRDTGLGIPADMLPRVFEMFAQESGTRARSQGGLGLGLAVAKRLVEMHGGRIEAHSAGPGQGSEFVLRLPLVGPAPQLAAPPSAATPMGKPLPAHRVLLVDDSRDVVYTLGSLLRRMGQEVSTAADAAAALQQVRRERPDVVISDIGMPEIDGYQFARLLRNEPGMEGVVLVALTGYGQDSDRERAITAGFDRHLVKPAGVQDLEQLLASLPAAPTRSEGPPQVGAPRPAAVGTFK
jgi:CheY-like chemotaxis protein